MGPRLYEGMSIQEITDYLFCADDLGPAELLIVFGGKRLEPAERAAQLFRDGLASRILITGGDRWGTGSCEAEVLKSKAVSLGVPESAILLETESVNTIENVRMSVAVVEEQIGWKQLQRVLLLSAPHHLRRVKQAISIYIPRTVQVLCCPDGRSDVTRDNWWHTAEGQQVVYKELEKVRSYAKQGET